MTTSEIFLGGMGDDTFSIECSPKTCLNFRIKLLVMTWSMFTKAMDLKTLWSLGSDFEYISNCRSASDVEPETISAGNPYMPENEMIL